ncbi:MAG: hypothetical protein ACYDEQ_15385 [Desulfocucumaceae bacterium]
MSANLKIVLRLAGIGLVILGLVADLPQGWAIASTGAGFVGIIAGGGGG